MEWNLLAFTLFPRFRFPTDARKIFSKIFGKYNKLNYDF